MVNVRKSSALASGLIDGKVRLWVWGCRHLLESGWWWLFSTRTMATIHTTPLWSGTIFRTVPTTSKWEAIWCVHHTCALSCLLPFAVHMTNSTVVSCTHATRVPWPIMCWLLQLLQKFPNGCGRSWIQCCLPYKLSIGFAITSSLRSINWLKGVLVKVAAGWLLKWYTIECNYLPWN